MHPLMTIPTNLGNFIKVKYEFFKGLWSQLNSPCKVFGLRRQNNRKWSLRIKESFQFSSSFSPQKFQKKNSRQYKTMTFQLGELKSMPTSLLVAKKAFLWGRDFVKTAMAYKRGFARFQIYELKKVLNTPTFQNLKISGVLNILANTHVVIKEWFICNLIF